MKIKKLFLALTIVLISSSPAWADVKIMKCKKTQIGESEDTASYIFKYENKKVFFSKSPL